MALPPGKQLTPYWDATLQRFSGPSGVYDGSIEAISEMQAVAATLAALPLGIAARPGIILGVRLAAITAATGNATYTVDIKKNGVTVLSAPVVLTSATAARASLAAALAVANTPFVVGDFFEAAITSTPGTGTAPANVFIQVDTIQN